MSWNGVERGGACASPTRASSTRVPARSATLFIGYLGTDTAFLEAPFTGTIAAPLAKLVVGGNSATTHQGSFFAKDLEVYPDVTVRLLAFSYPWVP